MTSGGRPDADGLQLTLFGSILDPTVEPGDIDLWMDGPDATVAIAIEQLERLGVCAGLSIDVSAAPRLSAVVQDACRWNAANGITILGTPPTHGSSADAEKHQTAFQVRSAREAVDVIAQAEILLGLGAREGPAFAELAARLYLRATATTPSEWRCARRVTSDSLAALIAPQRSPSFAHGAMPWADPIVVGTTRELIASISSFDPSC